MTDGYTDLHLHLIPAVDDGPRDEEETLELARLLVADGVERTAVTPHFNAWNPDLLSSVEEIEAKLVQLRALLEENGVPLEVLSGAEHFLTPELVDLVTSGRAPRLGPGPHVLVELPFHDRPLYADEVLYQLLLVGVAPVIAHPERYSWVQSNPDAIEPLVSRGIALQCTAASLTGHYGPKVKRTAEFLLSKGVYSLVGSDFHHPNQPRRLSQMAATITALAGEPVTRLLFFENPYRVLTGQSLVPVPGVIREVPRKRRFGIFG